MIGIRGKVVFPNGNKYAVIVTKADKGFIIVNQIRKGRQESVEHRLTFNDGKFTTQYAGGVFKL